MKARPSPTREESILGWALVVVSWTLIVCVMSLAEKHCVSQVAESNYTDGGTDAR